MWLATLSKMGMLNGWPFSQGWGYHEVGHPVKDGDAQWLAIQSRMGLLHGWPLSQRLGTEWLAILSEMGDRTYRYSPLAI